MTWRKGRREKQREGGRGREREGKGGRGREGKGGREGGKIRSIGRPEAHAKAVGSICTALRTQRLLLPLGHLAQVSRTVMRGSQIPVVAARLHRRYCSHLLQPKRRKRTLPTRQDVGFPNLKLPNGVCSTDTERMWDGPQHMKSEGGVSIDPLRPVRYSPAPSAGLPRWGGLSLGARALVVAGIAKKTVLCASFVRTAEEISKDDREAEV